VSNNAQDASEVSDQISRNRLLAEEIVRQVRRIVQSISIHSKKLYKETGLTVPQLLCMEAIQKNEGAEVAAADVSRVLQLSPATVTGIIDRLERAGMVRRARESADRRKVLLHLTKEGERKLEEITPSLQDRFLYRLSSLDEAELQSLLEAMQNIVVMIEGTEIDASPILTPGDVKKPIPEL
jgi:DNA-binding MarR family transcriptional regulator